MAKQFDLIDALKGYGFESDMRELEGGYLQYHLTKTYRKEDRVNDFGILNEDFTVEVFVRLEPYYGIPEYVSAVYSNGKVKTHGYDRRALNAIRATVRYNGFNL